MCRLGGFRRLAVASLAGAAAVFGLSLVACGVDGVTPDCSDAAVCLPYIGDAPILDSHSESSSETSSENDASASDAGGE